MADLYTQQLRYVDSRRLRLTAANVALIAADLEGKEALQQALQVQVPDNWPPELYDRKALEFASAKLRDSAERNWSFWYLVEARSQPEDLLGICGFKGRPDQTGSVEIGYSVLSQFQNKGYATEAVSCLVNWAFGHANVHRVFAETLPYLQQSIRVMEKNGFRFSGQGSERGVIRYSLLRSSLD